MSHTVEHPDRHDLDSQGWTRARHEAWIRKQALRCLRCEQVPATHAVSWKQRNGVMTAYGFIYCNNCVVEIKQSIVREGDTLLDEHLLTIGDAEAKVEKAMSEFPFRPEHRSTVGMIA